MNTIEKGLTVFGVRLVLKSILFILLGLPVVLFAVLFVASLLSQSGLSELTPEVRAASGGNFVRLRDGVIQYVWRGPATGDVVVLVHGFSTPSVVFEKNVGALAEAGYRVLTFDHFGRGYSDRPVALYDKDFFDRELLELLDVLGARAPVFLAGYSLGGGIATVFAARHPERVRKLVLFAPVGFMPPYVGVNRLLLLPVVGQWLMNLFGQRTLVDAFRRELRQGFATGHMLEVFERQFGYVGVPAALLATMRHYPMGDLRAEYEMVGRGKLPTLLVWGDGDVDVPFWNSEDVRQAVPGVRFVPVFGAGHSVVYSHAGFVNRVLVAFFGE